ncbi:GNAT family N-acetyltransferase [Halorussus halophilus]|uniref:GNAT family N-acetyltransferase n=1 Tax=Halorussus halophilus TaxID=2650975 RepID=UPI001300F7FA|nr:GNAT family protein [Halorussus halophilus]
MPGPVYREGDTLALRTVEREDEEFVQRAHNDPAVRVPVGLSHPENGTQVESYFEEKVENEACVNFVASVDGTPVGQVVAMDLDRTRPELSYWLLPEFHGEGYATEAVSLLIEFCFETYDVRGLYAQAYAYNEASWKLLERLGFEREGRLREDRFVRGEHRDTVHYGLLREEWESGE